METLATVTAANVRSRRTIITLGGLLLPDANLPAAAGGYQSITLNGQTTTLNWSLGHGTAGSWYGLTVNFQMDGNYQQSSYNVYLDNLTLSYQ